jgi:hypothetical protein
MWIDCHLQHRRERAGHVAGPFPFSTNLSERLASSRSCWRWSAIARLTVSVAAELSRGTFFIHGLTSRTACHKSGLGDRPTPIVNHSWSKRPHLLQCRLLTFAIAFESVAPRREEGDSLSAKSLTTLFGKGAHHLSFAAFESGGGCSPHGSRRTTAAMVPRPVGDAHSASALSDISYSLALRTAA